MDRKRMFTTDGNLCHARVRLGRAMCQPPLTQEGLARKVQFLGNAAMTKAIISRIEQNSRHTTDAELLILSQALGVSMEWLVEATDDPTRK